MTVGDMIYEMTRERGRFRIEPFGELYAATYSVVGKDTGAADEHEFGYHGWGVTGVAETPDAAVRKLYVMWRERTETK